jgi:hypothetical protein
VQIDPVIHVGDILVAIGGGLLTLFGWGMRRAFNSSMSFLRRVDGYEERIEDTAYVVDVHSDVLTKHGLAQGIEFQPVSKRRRRSDVRLTDEIV